MESDPQEETTSFLSKQSSSSEPFQSHKGDSDDETLEKRVGNGVGSPVPKIVNGAGEQSKDAHFNGEAELPSAVEIQEQCDTLEIKSEAVKSKQQESDGFQATDEDFLISPLGIDDVMSEGRGETELKSTDGIQIAEEEFLISPLGIDDVVTEDNGEMESKSADSTTVTSPESSRLSAIRSVLPCCSFLALPSDEDLMKFVKERELDIKFMRLVQRLGLMAEKAKIAAVIQELSVLGGGWSAYHLRRYGDRIAMLLESEGKDDIDFSVNILVLGKTGVGKSATINSILGEKKVQTNAFEPETTCVKLVTGVSDGVKLNFIDTPGLKSSPSEQDFNRKILASVKKFTKKICPDVMLYVDRLDSPTRDVDDIHIIRTITSSLGTSIWKTAILTFTHAGCALPDDPSGAPIDYNVFVRGRNHVIQLCISRAIGEVMKFYQRPPTPVSLVENHATCQMNPEAQPNVQAWRPQLLLLCYSLKIVSDARLRFPKPPKPQNHVDHRKLFGFGVRVPYLPYLLYTLLQPRNHLKVSADSDIGFDFLSDSDQEEEDEYDQLPPFKPLGKTEIAKLSKEQRQAYFDEYEYRVKLFQKQQWKMMRELKKNGNKSSFNDSVEMLEEYDPKNVVPVPLPDIVLPPSFDSNSPAYRFCFSEQTSQLFARPDLSTNFWDHDCGWDGVNVEHNLEIAGRYPASVSIQVKKDKKDSKIHLNSAISSDHGKYGSSLVGFDVQRIGEQQAYVVKAENKFKTLKNNKTSGGVSVTFLGKNVATGVKLEDRLALGKRFVLVGTTGLVRSQKDVAYGTNLEVHVKDADYPIGEDQCSLVLLHTKWGGDSVIGGSLQTPFSVGRSSKMDVRLALNSKQCGQISVKTSSSENFALAYVGLIPIALAIYKKFRPCPSDIYF